MDFASPNIVKRGHNNYEVSHGDDASNHVEFYQEAVLNEVNSTKEGRPQYDNVDYITIMFPGDKTKILKKPVNQDFINRYPNQWRAYKEGKEQIQSGLPITEWAILTKAEALNMKSLGIHTVEALAGLPDTALTWFGARSYRDKAVATLNNSKDGSFVLGLKHENEVLKNDLEALKKQVEELSNLKTKEKDKK